MAEIAYQADPKGSFSYIDFSSTEAGQNSGTGSGTQQVFQNEPIPDDPSLPALSFPTGGGVLTQWDVASQSWV